MSRVKEPTAEEQANWDTWVASRPPHVRAIAERFDPWSLYRLKSTGHRVYLKAINENGTVRVDVSGEYNIVAFSRSVFGIDPDDLEPCDPPAPGEIVGGALDSTLKDLDADERRELIQALWPQAKI